jgi:hypothetical protein
VVLAKDSYLCEQKHLELTARDLGDDPVFGFMNNYALDEFFATDRLHAAHWSVQSAQGLALVIGTGASLIAQTWDALVYCDMARWELQQRQRSREITNLGLTNFGDRPSLKYKRAFFVDWRVADRHKKTLLDRIDYLLDTNDRTHAKMIPGSEFRRALDIAADVVMVTLGTGIGGAVLMNGKVLRGKHILGGNLCGHIPVDFNGRRCTCGAIGCAEAEAGGWSLPLVAAAWPGFAKRALSREPAVSFRSLFEHATQGDSVALAIQERCLRIWATLTTGLIHSFDPDVVVFGGGVLANADVIVPYIQKHVIEYAWTPWGEVRIKPAKLGSRAALLGAIPLLTGGPAAALSG